MDSADLTTVSILLSGNYLNFLFLQPWDGTSGVQPILLSAVSRNWNWENSTSNWSKYTQHPMIVPITQTAFIFEQKRTFIGPSHLPTHSAQCYWLLFPSVTLNIFSKGPLRSRRHNFITSCFDKITSFSLSVIISQNPSIWFSLNDFRWIHWLDQSRQCPKVVTKNANICQ